jgi:hypothetical protein
MKNLPDETEGLRLARLLGEIDELESIRAALLERAERLRVKLLQAGDRSVGMRASVQLLCDHVSDAITEAAEIEALEQEMIGAEQLEQEMLGAEQEVGRIGRESSGLEFELTSWQESLDDAEQDLEQLSSILIERKLKHSRGH